MKRRDWLHRCGTLLAAFPAAALPVVLLPVASLRAPAQPHTPRLAVALGSGSMHGLAHIGVVRAFEKLQLQPDLIVGCSAGAAVGALWAAGLSAARIEAMAMQMNFTALRSWTLPWRGLMSNLGVQRVIDEAVGHRLIEQLPIAFAAVATALDDGRRVTLDRGGTGIAVAASSAIPVLFEPVRVLGRDLIDGSLSAPVPVDLARERGAHVVVAVDVAYRPSDAPARHLADMAFQALHILVNALATEQVARADLALRLALHEVMIHSATQVRALIDAGEAGMMGQAERLRALLRR